MTATPVSPAPQITAGTTVIHNDQQLTIGQSRDFPAGRHTVAVTRTGHDAYRVIVLDLRGLSVPCYTATFDSAAGNLPVGMTGRRAAWEYAQPLIGQFTEAAETPRQVTARVTAASVAFHLAKLSQAQRNALAAHVDGFIAKGAGASEATLRSLRKLHLGRIVYTSQGLRNYITTGLELNGDGRMVAELLAA
jgi:hypothetical protein